MNGIIFFTDGSNLNFCDATLTYDASIVTLHAKEGILYVPVGSIKYIATRNRA